MLGVRLREHLSMRGCSRSDCRRRRLTKRAAHSSHLRHVTSRDHRECRVYSKYSPPCYPLATFSLNRTNLRVYPARILPKLLAQRKARVKAFHKTTPQNSHERGVGRFEFQADYSRPALLSILDHCLGTVAHRSSLRLSRLKII